jgi:hypothetical protein
MRFAMMMSSVAVLLCAGASDAQAATRDVSAPSAVAAVAIPVSAALATVQDAQAQPQPQTSPGDVKVDIGVERTEHVWYADPMWIALGVVALVVIVLAIVLAGRGGDSTTVVR